MIKTFDANESGQSEFNGSGLTSGTYTYTLTLNGKVALSKQMLTIKWNHPQYLAKPKNDANIEAVLIAGTGC